MYLRKKHLIALSLIYIYIPILIFLIGWTKIYIAAVCIAALAYGLMKFHADYTGKTEEAVIRVDVGILCFVFFILLVVGYCAGWGRFVNQSLDWAKHSAVLNDLVEKNWPVYYINRGGGIRRAFNADILYSAVHCSGGIWQSFPFIPCCGDSYVYLGGDWFGTGVS